MQLTFGAQSTEHVDLPNLLDDYLHISPKQFYQLSSATRWFALGEVADPELPETTQTVGFLISDQQESRFELHIGKVKAYKQ